MKIIHYIKLHNFKVFGEEKIIELDQPSVLIGPNNSGKTSTLQAMALWSIGLKRWYENKGQSKGQSNIRTGINRLDIIQVPVQEARYFWKNTEIRKGGTNYIPLEITLGLNFENRVYDCKISFTHYTPELIYCSPSEDFILNKKLLAFAASINVEILYPMSGMITEEILLPVGRLNVLIGQGRTAEVLRNLCYKILEEDKANNTSQWQDVVLLMKQHFHIKLLEPSFISSRGSIDLKYTVESVKNPLDISLAGRGLQQMLLLTAYLYSHRNSILLLDEPDAHLEILRQKLIFTLLRDVSIKNGNQVIIATHSEVILDEASDTNLVMIIDGEPMNIADKKNIKHALKNFGIEHYYKAKIKKNILYVEGSTDIQILKEFASVLGRNEIVKILEEPINYYYIQNNENENNSQNALDNKQGYYKRNHEEHFYAIRSVIKDFKGLAIFDSDNRNKKTESREELTTFYWKRYEIENYFISPKIILRYMENIIVANGKPLYESKNLDDMISAINNVMLEVIFDNNTEAQNQYLILHEILKETYWFNNTKNLKLSSFLEQVFEEYKSISGQPIMMNKGRFFELIKYMNPSQISTEVVEALDLLSQYLSPINNESGLIV